MNGIVFFEYDSLFLSVVMMFPSFLVIMACLSFYLLSVLISISFCFI